MTENPFTSEKLNSIVRPKSWRLHIKNYALGRKNRSPDVSGLDSDIVANFPADSLHTTKDPTTVLQPSVMKQTQRKKNSNNLATSITNGGVYNKSGFIINKTVNTIGA